jgi:RNA polymerase primary sigma factor
MARTSQATTGAFDRYLADIRQIPQLNREQERRVAREIRSGRHGAINELVEGNLAFVIKIANEYRWRSVPFEDLVNAGNLGLIGAARRFDVGRNVRFTTYASFWIRKSILKEVAEQSRIVSLPAYQSQRQREIVLAEKALRRTLGRKPSRGELADHLSTTVDHLERVLRHGGSEISLDDPSESTPGAVLRHRLAEPDGDSIEQRIHQQELISDLQRILDELNERQRAVVTLRYGLDGTSPCTLAEIGCRMGVSRERVRQIEREAIRSLRASLKRPRTLCARNRA